MTPETRPDRPTADPLVRLRQVLETFRRAGSYETLALADDHGLLIAGAGHFARCEELAALSAHTPSSRSAARFELLGSPVLLCAASSGASEGLDPIQAESLLRKCARALGARRDAVSTTQ